MSDRTVRLINELTRAARMPGACLDPAFHMQKAATFDAVAEDNQNPDLAAEAREWADAARARARELADYHAARARELRRGRS